MVEERALELAEKQGDTPGALKQDSLSVEQNQMRKELQEGHFENVYGLSYIIDELLSFYDVLNLQKKRTEAGIDIPLLDATHFAVVGSRGSGKTRIGEIIGKLLYEFDIREAEDAEILSAREITEAYNTNRGQGIEKFFKRSELKGKTIIIENFQDTFLNYDYDKIVGRRICLYINKIMQRQKDDFSIVITMDKNAFSFIQEVDPDFVDVLYNVIEIQQYSIESLVAIAKQIASDEKGLIIDEKAEKLLFHKIDQNYHSDTFMNAISIKRYLNDAVKRMAKRYWDSPPEEELALAKLEPSDFEVEFSEETLDQLLAELTAMTGLQEVKEAIEEVINKTKVDIKARENDAKSQSGVGTMQMIFTGNPGTGKTTVARMIGKIYQQLGILPRGHHTIECSRGNLVGLYLGHTADLVRKRFMEAEGGVLFIDEAYALCRDERDYFGQEAIDELTKQIEDHHKDVLVIIAGYDEPINKFLDKNEGLRSRFQKRITFRDYLPEEMVSIFKGMVKERGKYLEEGTDALVTQLINEKSKTPDFGNARGVRNVLGYVEAAQSNRIQKELSILGDNADVPTDMFDCIKASDIQTVLQRKEPGEKTLDELLRDMNAMPGLQGAKRAVTEQINRLSYQKIMKERGIGFADKQGTMHMLFKGNAGTGKTTMARIIAQIYQRLGILKKNTLYEVKRADLVGRYVGETAQKTLQVLNKADGGVLFIDEAYDLVHDAERDSFGLEALNTLVADLENRRDSLIVIMAGYGDDLDKLLKINQGLESRFPNHVYFEDYSIDELVSIFYSMLQTWNQDGVAIEDDLQENVRLLIEHHKSKKSNFGNARGVRNIIEEVLKNMQARVVKDIKAGKELSDKDLVTIRKPDLEV